MGTNYYIKRVKPRLVYDEYHIAKISAGWRVHFEAYPHSAEDYPYEPCDEERPEVASVADIRALLESGEYRLTNENYEEWEPGPDSLEKLDELLAWNGGPAFDGRPCGRYPDGEPPYENDGLPGSYRDPEGFVFSMCEFF